ncbi:hypothetical protein [Massilia cavernae]|nr:hypothetical protein [Massilia cavernae]
MTTTSLSCSSENDGRSVSSARAPATNAIDVAATASVSAVHFRDGRI